MAFATRLHLQVSADAALSCKPGWTCNPKKLRVTDNYLHFFVQKWHGNWQFQLLWRFNSFWYLFGGYFSQQNTFFFCPGSYIWIFNSYFFTLKFVKQKLINPISNHNLRRAHFILILFFLIWKFILETSDMQFPEFLFLVCHRS